MCFLKLNENSCKGIQSSRLFAEKNLLLRSNVTSVCLFTTYQYSGSSNRVNLCPKKILPNLKSHYRDSLPNAILSNMDFAPTRFWFRDKKIHIYTVISAIFLWLCIVQSQGPPTVFFSSPKMRIRRGVSVFEFILQHMLKIALFRGIAVIYSIKSNITDQK